MLIFPSFIAYLMAIISHYTFSYVQELGCIDLMHRVLKYILEKKYLVSNTKQ